MTPMLSVEVNLEVSSWIHGRGVRHTNWKVQVNDALVSIKDLRHVASTMTDPDLSFDDEVDEMRVLPPGCQYRITYHPRLLVGTRVQRRISVPLELPPQHRHKPETMEAAFSRLMAAGYGPKLPLKTTFTDYRVTSRGLLVTEEAWQRREQSRRSASAPPTSRDERRQAPASVTGDEVQAFLRRVVG